MMRTIGHECLHSLDSPMPSDKPWLDGPSPREQALARIWQGGCVLLIGGTATAGTYFVLGIVWIWTVVAAVCGLFWLLAGIVTLLTGYE
jgi:hypothetical protein